MLANVLRLFCIDHDEQDWQDSLLSFQLAVFSYRLQRTFEVWGVGENLKGLVRRWRTV